MRTSSQATPSGNGVIVFDFDGTLALGDSYARFVLRRLAMNPARILLSLLALPFIAPWLWWSKAPSPVLSAITWGATWGMPPRRYVEALCRFGRRHVDAQSVAPIVAALRDHLASGRTVLIASGSVTPILRAVLSCSELRVDTTTQLRLPHRSGDETLSPRAARLPDCRSARGGSARGDSARGGSARGGSAEHEEGMTIGRSDLADDEPAGRSAASRAGERQANVPERLGRVRLVGSRQRYWLGGVVSTRHCIGRRKLEAVELACAGLPLDEVYTDSALDLPLLCCARRAVIVNPSAGTLQRIRRRAPNLELRVVRFPAVKPRGAAP